MGLPRGPGGRTACCREGGKAAGQTTHRGGRSVMLLWRQEVGECRALDPVRSISSPPKVSVGAQAARDPAPHRVPGHRLCLCAPGALDPGSRWLCGAGWQRGPGPDAVALCQVLGQTRGRHCGRGRAECPQQSVWGGEGGLAPELQVQRVGSPWRGQLARSRHRLDLPSKEGVPRRDSEEGAWGVGSWGLRTSR